MDFRLQLLVVSTKKRWFPTALGGLLLLAGCVPAPVVTSPMVSGRVTDARSGRPVAGALVTVSVDKGTGPADAPAKSTPHTLSDADGQFTLSERYGLGLVGFIGDPFAYRAVVRVTREGYVETTTTQPCIGSDGRPSKPVHVFPELNPARRSE